MAGTAAENHGWFAYSVIPFVALVAALLPSIIQLFVRIFSDRSEQTDLKALSATTLSSRGSVVPREQNLNTRYFAAAQLGALITLPFVLLIPLVGREVGRSPYAAVALIMFCLSGGVALIYVNRKGDLRWIDTLGASREDVESPSEGPGP